MLKGHGGSPIFRDDTDGKTFEALASDGVRRFGHRVHAYCALPGQVRLVVEVGEAPLGRVMQNLAYRYTLHVNGRYGRSGPLFHDRYRAVLVDPDNYLVSLVRYVHRRPVAAGLCHEAHRYRWSSHRSYLGLDPKPWISHDMVLSMLGPTPDEALAAYRDTMAWLGEGPGPRAMDYGFEDGILGDADFRVAVRAGRSVTDARDCIPDITLDELTRRVSRALGLEMAALSAPGRARDAAVGRHTIGYLAFEHGIASLTDVADLFGRDLTTLSRGVERLRRRMENEPDLERRVGGII